MTDYSIFLVLVPFLPSALMVWIWHHLRQRHGPLWILLLAWLLIASVIAIVGLAGWEEHHECTRLFNAVLPPSLTLFSGLILVGTFRNDNKIGGRVFFLCMLAVFPSFWLSFFVLARLGQVWI